MHEREVVENEPTTIDFEFNIATPTLSFGRGHII